MNHHTDISRPRASDVHVIGGGLGGLAAAALVARTGRSVTVHEGRRGLGGQAATDDHHGYRFNRGPHAFYADGDGARVLRSLGISPSGRSPATKDARMVDAERFGVMPGGPFSLLRSPLLGARDKLSLARVLGGIGRLDPSAVASLTVDEWVDGVTDRPRVRRMLHAVIRLATYVNAPGVMSAQVALMQVQLALDGGVLYLDGGWEQLTTALASVPGVEVAEGERITELPDAPCVIVATGGPRAATALTGAEFDVGPPAEVSVLDVGLSRPPQHDFVLGVDPPLYLSNHGFPSGMTPTDRWSVSVAEYLGSTVEPDRDRLRSFLTYAGIVDDAIETERHLHRMPAVTAIATAAAGGLSGRPTGVLGDRPGVFVVGDWVGPRGHLLDAVLASAQDAALAAVAHLDRRLVAR
ncbi:MAG: NAD(P)-binding protein [Ilumatobacter sp.]|uniref:NAD(P)-binding protein n=1 Tax=Ilumatobacter sp. TaxID=1967498 RepID=UPI00329A332F